MRIAISTVAALLAALTTLPACSSKSSVTEQQLKQIAALQAEIAALDRQAGLIKDANDIKRLQRAYGYYLDQAKWDEMADLFAKDGSIEIALNGVYRGQVRVREFLHALGNGKTGLQEGQLNEHMMLQPVVNVAPDGMTAKARWRAFIMMGEYGKNAFWGEGPYENEYVKEDGEWKISKLHWYQTFIVPYDGGWMKNKDATGGKFSLKGLSPDAPPSEDYGVWPKIYTPPFHFKNPVSGK